MMANDIWFTPTHEWVRVTGDVAEVGITDHAQEELGDVALVQLPDVGRVLQLGEKFGEIESIKAVSELYSPLTGEIIEINEDLETSPEQVNDDPYGEGWMVKIRLAEPDEVGKLLSEAGYQTVLDKE
jgi:glycine cleavage system H protein